MVMNRTMHFCTLFDSNYLDKALAMYESLCNVCENFMLYIFAFDQKAYDILNGMALEHIMLVSLLEFETEELLQVKEQRSKGEYCWTCTPVVIKYVLEKYQVDCCTYIDSDLYFYQSPQILLDEFYESGKSVGLVAHRFPNTCNGKKAEQKSGKYCVQFNTFKNDLDGKRLLEMWRLQCLKECDIKKGGDQLYITDWGEKYAEVHDYQHLGAGVAPWNLANYKVKKVDGALCIRQRKKECKMIFYHFQGIQYSQDGYVKIGVIAVPDGGLISGRTVQYIYFPYLKHIENIREMLEEKYGLCYYKDGCDREFKVIKFDFKKFMKSFIRRWREDSIQEAMDLLIRVFRKKEDIISLRDVRGEKYEGSTE